MNKSYRDGVNNYINEYNCEPLEFYSLTWNQEKRSYDDNLVKVEDMSVAKLGLQQVIINTLKHNLEFSSGINKYLETPPESLRSSLDIWRHIKKYNPKITIFDVMKCIADNVQDMCLYSHYCCTIDRRVFRIADDKYEEEIIDDDERDEFGLTFYEWSEL